MNSRRDFLKAGLAACGCATCDLFGFGAQASAGEADGPTVVRGEGYDLWFIGAQRETIMNGKLTAVLDLRTLSRAPHLYGVGPFEQLRGEVTIANSRPSLARVAANGTVAVAQSFEMGAPFFVWAEVPQWRQVLIPADIRSYEELERFVPKAAAAAGLDAEKPLPFLVGGVEDPIEFHILNRIGDGPVTVDIHKRFQIPFELEKVEAMIVGFHSTKHHGVFTPGESNIHIHFQTPDNSKSGHIQRLELGKDAILSLPVA